MASRAASTQPYYEKGTAASPKRLPRSLECRKGNCTQERERRNCANTERECYCGCSAIQWRMSLA